MQPHLQPAAALPSSHTQHPPTYPIPHTPPHPPSLSLSLCSVLCCNLSHMSGYLVRKKYFCNAARAWQETSAVSCSTVPARWVQIYGIVPTGFVVLRISCCQAGPTRAPVRRPMHPHLQCDVAKQRVYTSCSPAGHRTCTAHLLQVRMADKVLPHDCRPTTSRSDVLNGASYRSIALPRTTTHSAPWSNVEALAFRATSKRCDLKSQRRNCATQPDDPAQQHQ